MAEQWYYTSEGRQMEPVSEGELKRLASRGLLKPTDLVWQEGMAKWERAGNHKELFVPAAREEEEGSSYRVTGEKPTAARAEAEEERPVRRLQRRDEEDEDYEERPRKRRKKQKSNAGLIWGLVGGGIGLVALVVGAIVIINAMTPSGPTRSWSLRMDGKQTYRLNFQAGKKVEIWVKSAGDSDVDLFVFPPGTREQFVPFAGDLMPKGQVAFDISDSKDCYVTFVAPAGGAHEVIVWNRVLRPPLQGRNKANSGTLEFKESEPGALAVNPPPVVVPIPMPGDPGPAPFPRVGGGKRPLITRPLVLQKGLTTTTGAVTPIDGQDPTRPNCYCWLYSVQLEMGKTYTFDMESRILDSYLRLEDPAGQQVAENDDRDDNTNDARIVFQPPQTGMYKLYASTFVPRQAGPFSLKVKQD